MQQVRFSIAAGESLALIGETGSGKTMIALSILGLLPENVTASGGETRLDGTVLSTPAQHRRRLGTEIVYIPQNGLESLNPSRGIRDQLYDGLKRLGVPRRERQSMAAENLRRAGFESPEAILGLYPFQLSGGMAQRVTIALAAGSRARLVIADEPTNGLDARGRGRFLELLDEVFPEAARLVITHDLSVAALCSRVLVLCGGMTMEQGSIARVRHPYTRALQNALVENGMQETPILRQEAGACPFYRRCPAALPRCREVRDHHRAEDSEWWCSGP